MVNQKRRTLGSVKGELFKFQLSSSTCLGQTAVCDIYPVLWLMFLFLNTVVKFNIFTFSAVCRIWYENRLWKSVILILKEGCNLFCWCFARLERAVTYKKSPADLCVITKSSGPSLLNAYNAEFRGQPRTDPLQDLQTLSNSWNTHTHTHTPSENRPYYANAMPAN